MSLTSANTYIRVNKSLKKLTAFMAATTNSTRPLSVAAISHQTGISDPTIRRLIRENPGLFSTTNSHPIGYFYLPSPLGQRILDEANLSIGGVAIANAHEITSQPSDNTTVAGISNRERIDNIKQTMQLSEIMPVVQEGMGTLDTNNAEHILKMINVLTATVELMSERVKELTK